MKMPDIVQQMRVQELESKLEDYRRAAVHRLNALIEIRDALEDGDVDDALQIAKIYTGLNDNEN
jgi:hypothetical protein